MEGEIVDQLWNTVQQFYTGSAEAVYPHARRLFCGDDIAQTNLSAPAPQSQFFLVRIDQISNRLAYALTEYRRETGYCREVLGMIRCRGVWQIVCAACAQETYRFGTLYSDNPQQQRQELDELEHILLRYCRDVYQMDAEDCLSLFWDGAKMYHPNADETFTDVEIRVLRTRWANRSDPAEQGITEFSRIYHIEMLSADTAIAKVGCAKLDHYFQDYLTLMKPAGHWKIVNKMTQELYTGQTI